MKTVSIIAATLLTATPAFAHPSHVSAAGHGHDHWLAIAAFAAIVGVAVTAWRRLKSAPAR